MPIALLSTRYYHLFTILIILKLTGRFERIGKAESNRESAVSSLQMNMQFEMGYNGGFSPGLSIPFITVSCFGKLAGWLVVKSALSGTLELIRIFLRLVCTLEVQCAEKSIAKTLLFAQLFGATESKCKKKMFKFRKKLGSSSYWHFTLYNCTLSFKFREMRIFHTLSQQHQSEN